MEKKKEYYPLSYAVASRSRHILVTGLSNTLVLVWMQTERTNPLESAFVLRTLPINQDPLGAVASAMMTISP